MTTKILDRRVALSPPLLAGMTEADTRAVLAVATVAEYPAGAVLCRQGDPADAMFMLGDGRVRFARATAQGRDVLLRWLCAGECFGLASLVPGAVEYMGTALTASRTRVWTWGAADIRSAARNHPRLAENALRIALHYLEEFGERHGSLLTHTAEQRLGRALTHLGATAGRVLPEGVEIEISNHDLAALADVGMFTVSRQLKRWERDGHLVKKRRRVLLRHPEALLS